MHPRTRSSSKSRRSRRRPRAAASPEFHTMAFIPHTDDDVRAMLDTIGVKSIEDLFD
jgi:hypothetical protein